VILCVRTPAFGHCVCAYATGVVVETTAMAIIWKCLICGHHQQGDQPPDHCPSCGAPKEEFVLVEED